MLLHLFCLLAALLQFSDESRASAFTAHKKDMQEISVLESRTATLPCAHKSGDVSWSRLIRSEKVILLSIINGEEKNKKDKRYGSLADNSLVITNVKDSDSAVYWCNKSQIYLNVTNDPNMVSTAGNGPVTPRNPGPGQTASAGPGAADDQQRSDFWKVPVGVFVGAALMLFAILTLRFWFKKRAETNTKPDKTAVEVIYEEIEDGVQQRESDVERPYYWSSITDSPIISTPPKNNLYSTVNKSKTAGRSTECVYYLAQSPAQTGSITH